MKVERKYEMHLGRKRRDKETEMECEVDQELCACVGRQDMEPWQPVQNAFPCFAVRGREIDDKNRLNILKCQVGNS